MSVQSMIETLLRQYAHERSSDKDAIRTFLLAHASLVYLLEPAVLMAGLSTGGVVPIMTLRVQEDDEGGTLLCTITWPEEFTVQEKALCTSRFDAWWLTVCQLSDGCLVFDFESNLAGIS